MKLEGPRLSKEEIEIKLPCDDLETLRQKLRELSAANSAPLHLEVNDLFDRADRSLSGAGAILRLRQAQGDAILTFKGPGRFEQGIKRREERETKVSDAKETEAILRGLGFTRTFRYEKRREEWILGSCRIALDETPIGRFVEIEGDPTQIRRAVSALSLDSASALPYSYPQLYARRRKEQPDLPEDMVFQDRKA